VIDTALVTDLTRASPPPSEGGEGHLPRRWSAGPPVTFGYAAFQKNIIYRDA